MTLRFATEIADGQHRFTFDPGNLPPEGYAQTVNVVRSNLPSLAVIPSDPERYKAGQTALEASLRKELDELRQQMLSLGALTKPSDLPDKLITGTLHEAFEAYKEHPRTNNVQAGTSNLTAYGKLRLQRIDRFLKAHPEVPLHSLTLEKCTAMVTHWRNRPMSFYGKPISVKDASHNIKELFRFFRWLNASDKFQWETPKGFGDIERRVVKRQEEKRLSVITKEVWTVEELATLNKHATPLERMMLYLGLNCASGAAELGRLEINEFHLEEKHLYAKRLVGFESTEQDSFLTVIRPKTEVFGEWYLWPETVQIVRWGVERSRKIGSTLIFVTEKGNRWYDENCTNAQAKFANEWNRLLDRTVKSEPAFRRLPFGALRDTMTNTVRSHYDGELAHMVLAHGTAFVGDNLLDAYANKPWGKLHAALKELHGMYAPVFHATSSPLATEKHYLPIATKERVREMLAEGAGVGEVAKVTGVSRATVYRVQDSEG